MEKVARVATRQLSQTGFLPLLQDAKTSSTGSDAYDNVRNTVACSLTFVSWVIFATEVWINGYLGTNTFVYEKPDHTLVTFIYDLRICLFALQTAAVLSACLCKRKEMADCVSSVRDFAGFEKTESDSPWMNMFGSCQVMSLHALFMTVLVFSDRLLLAFRLQQDPTCFLPGNYRVGDWLMMSNFFQLPLNYIFFLMLELSVQVISAPTKRINALERTAYDMLALCDDISSDKNPKATEVFQQRVAHVRQEYDKICLVLLSIEDSFGILLTVYVLTFFVNIFSLLPLFFKETFMVIVRDLVPTVIGFLTYPLLMLILIMYVSSRDMAKSSKYRRHLSDTIGRIYMIELDAKIEKLSVLNNRLASWTGKQHPCDVLETLIQHCEQRPLSAKLGFIGFVDSGTVATVITIFVGYLCFLIEKADDHHPVLVPVDENGTLYQIIRPSMERSNYSLC